MAVKSRSVRKILTGGAVLSVLALPTANAAAMDTFFAGPRAMGMGGANVASVNDTTAQYYNPAAFGYFGCQDPQGKKIACDNNNLGRKKWGVDVNAAAGYRLHNEFGTFLNELSDVEIDDLNSVQDSSDLQDLVKILGSLKGLDDPGNAITADATAGLGIRFGHFAVGTRAFLQATGQVIEIDTLNLGLTGQAGQDLNNQLNQPGLIVDNGEPAIFTEAQRTALIGAGLDDAQAIRNLEIAMAREGLSQEQINQAIELLVGDGTQENPGLIAVTEDPSLGGPLSSNTTTVVLRGFGVAEVPLSYGYAINDNLSIGGSLKLMRGRVYGNQVIVFDDDSDDVIAQTDEEYKETTTFGVDLGVMVRFPYVNLGIVGRNLNSPKFDGFTKDLGFAAPLVVDDVTLDPQVTAGAAFIPFETLTFEVDYDLTKNETAFPGYDTQNLSFGLEWDAFRFLALRAGAFKNLAESDIDWVYTAGLGLNLWAARLDLAGAFSTEKEEFDGDEIPSETRVAAQLSVDF